jgi:hypothetical protein
MLKEFISHHLFIHCLFLFLFEWILIGGNFTLLEKLQDDAFLLESIYVIRRMIISELHRFVVVILILFEHVELESSFRESR